MNPATALSVHPAPGKLPPWWERQVIFVANLMSLFFGNRGETQELRRQVGPIESYGGRLVPILGLMFRGPGPNVVVLERSPDVRLLAYFKHDLGLELPDVAVLSPPAYQSLNDAADATLHPELARFVAEHRNEVPRWLDGFVTDPALERLARLLGCRTISSAEASHTGNDKRLLHEHLAAAGLPVFDTRIVAEPRGLPEALAALRQLGYGQAVVKSPIGASGIGIEKISTADDGRGVSGFLFQGGPCLVQGWLDTRVAGVEAVHSPSVQLFLDEGSLYLYEITDQILDAQSTHEGNLAPPPWLAEWPDVRGELLRQAEEAGTWLHQQGYRGAASADFHVAIRRGQAEVRVCEVNARMTGATYPSVLARHFTPGNAWCLRNLSINEPRSGHDVLTALDGAGLLFRPGADEAILPVNFNPDASGAIVKGQFLALAPTTDRAAQLLEKACSVLPVAEHAERD